MRKPYQPNWILILAMSIAFHGALLGSALLVKEFWQSEVPQVASGGLIDLEDAPDTDDIGEVGYKDGNENGSLLGKADAGQGLTNVSDQEIGDESAAKEEVTPDEAEEKPIQQEDALLTEETTDENPIVATGEEDMLRQYKKQMSEAKNNENKKIANTIVVRKKGGGHHQMGQPPKLLTTFYPPERMGNFRGVVKVAIYIGEKGDVTGTKVMVTSGNRAVDELAMSACRRWTFKPALDSHGEPMECYKIVGIPFNVSARLDQITKEKNS